MAYELPVPRPGKKSGGIYSVGYNAWQGGKGLSGMFDALEAEGVTILVDTRNSDFRGRYSYDQLAQTATERTGINGRPMRFAPRSALTGKPRQDEEYTPAGQADYAVMDTRSDATHVLDGMVEAAYKGERIALLCACADTCTCHRTRWLAESLAKRGVDVGHIEPGEFDRERYREEGVQELYRITPHSELPNLPSHSDINWREQAERWNQPKEPQPIPKGYRSPQATKPIPPNPSQILIAGSMNANNAQLNYASALVMRAAEIGAQIHVGDNDQGVDARVVETANAIGYHDVVVWTAGGTPRNGGVEGGQVYQVPYNYKEQGNRYTQRDRTMIRGVDDEEGAAFFIDNGHTHHRNGRMTGTEAGYGFAVEHGKAARKVSFGRPKDREAELKPLPTTYVPHYRPQLPEFDPSLFERPAPPISDPTAAILALGEVDSALRPSKPLTDVEKWDMALETAETLAAERERNAVYTRRPGHRTAEVLDMQILPVTDQKGDSLGYAVAAVDVRWRATPFKINTDDWRGADTVSMTEVAHFKHEQQAETYKDQLHGFMEAHDMVDDPAKRRDFLREVGQLNGLRAGIHTTDLIRMGATQLPDHRAEIGALQAGEWELKTVKLGFHPMDKDVLKPPPEPLYGFSIHAAQTVDMEGQHLGYSTVALRDVYENGLPIESDISERYVMELARFEKQDDAKQYADGLMEYIKDKPDLEFIGSPENIAGTQAFLESIAPINGLQVVEETVQKRHLLDTGTIRSHSNMDTASIQSLNRDQDSLHQVFDLDL
ncbi:MAG: DUF488 domain-containing protein [Chloroflexi bacterium]|nr:DUF488 domain-containing protein [Chloroflexota bacterium]